MFEGTLVESRGLEGTGTGRWTAMGSVALQCTVVGMVLLIPLLRPQVLTLTGLTAPVTLPLLHRPAPAVRATAQAAASAQAWSRPAEPAPATATQPAVLPSLHAEESSDAPALNVNGGMRSGGTTEGLLSSLTSMAGTGNSIAVVPRREPGPLNVSLGVAEGMLLEPIRPVYPAIARAARVQGTVVIEALVSKTGKVESVHALSGPPMLQGAAVSAVEAARYRPYLLNGEPAEVKAMFTVVFSLGA